MRYPTDTWSKADARAHCKEHDGTFEGAEEEDSAKATDHDVLFNEEDLLQIELEDNELMIDVDVEDFQAALEKSAVSFGEVFKRLVEGGKENEEIIEDIPTPEVRRKLAEGEII